MRVVFARTPFVQMSPRVSRIVWLALAALAVVWPVGSWAAAAVNSPPLPRTTAVALSEDHPDVPSAPDIPPVITDFTITSHPGNLWTFEGTVDDESPSGVIIVFGGLIDGTEVPVTEEGTFSITIELPAGSTGGVTAQAIDEAGQASDTAEDVVE